MDDTAVPPPGPVAPGPAPWVTAVLVCHDGARWLPRVLTGLADQARPVDELVVVDTGSRDGTADVLREALPAGTRLLTLPRRASFGEAVAAAVDTSSAGAAAATSGPSAPGEHWLWLLHDDSAPEPAALERLLAHAQTAPLADVLGCKARGWNDSRLLLEVGFTASRSGRRDTGLETGEQDQGQHDLQRQVLAVGTAGMLVRRATWQALGGLDRRLPVFREDLDFCWQVWRSGGEVHVVPGAVVAHAEAATLGRRAMSVRGRRPHYLDRRNAILTLLWHRHPVLLPLLMLRALLGGVTRTAGFLLGKAPGFAIDEARALLALVVRPDRLATGRVRRSRRVAALRRSRPVCSAVPTPSLTAPRAAARHTWEGLLAVGSGAASALAVGTRARRLVPVETGPAAEEAQDLETGPGLLGGLLRRPVVLLLLALLVLTLVADRHLVGAGRLSASGMLPAPAGAADWWHLVRWPWHDAGGGTEQRGPLWALLLAGLSVLTLGAAPLAVDLLVLGAIPLAALSAALSLRGLVRTTSLRVAAAAVWALQPLLLVGLSHGTLPVVVAALALPPAAAAVARVVGVGRPGSARAGAAGALAVAVVGTVAPTVALLACGLTLVVAVAVAVRRLVRAVVRRSVRAAGSVSLGGLLCLALLPPVLLWPDLASVVDPLTPARRWAPLLNEAGTVLPAWPTQPPAWQVLSGAPGGAVPGVLAAVTTIALALLAALGLLRRDRRAAAALTWLVTSAVLTSAVGLALVLRLAAVDPTRSPAGQPVGTDLSLPWPTPEGPGRGLVGVLGLCLQAALVAGGLVAAAGSRPVLSWHRFGWRQPALAALAAGALAIPALGMGLAVVHGLGSVGGPGEGSGQADLHRSRPLQLPAYVAAAAATGRAPRTLVVAQETRGSAARVVLVGAALPRLGEESLTAAPPDLLPVAADLLGGRLVDAAAALQPWSVRFIALGAGAAPRLRAVLDTTAGLQRVGGQRGVQVWEVGGQTPLAWWQPGGGAGSDGSAAAQADPATATPVAAHVDPRALVDTSLAPAATTRVLHVAVPGSDQWSARLGGSALARAGAGAGQLAFVLPAGTGGRLQVGHDDPRRTELLVALAALLVTVVLALPGVRRPTPVETPGSPTAGALP